MNKDTNVNNKISEKITLHHWQVIAIGLMCFDAVAIGCSYFFGLWLRFDFMYTAIPDEYMHIYVISMPFYIVAAVVFFHFMNMYRGIWRFVGLNELVQYCALSVIISMGYCIAVTLIFTRMPFSYYVVGAVMQTILVTGIRFSYRFYLDVCKRRGVSNSTSAASKVMIIGAGAAGRSVVSELLKQGRTEYKLCCIIDDNPNKWGRLIDGVPVKGGRESILHEVRSYDIDQIYFCIPTAKAQEKKTILDICKKTGCELKSLPGIYQLANDEYLVSRLRPVAIEDLLGREPVKVDTADILAGLKGKRILVTGGGGSIGSELCRQIADNEPEKLIIFDIYENTTYQIELELREKHPQLDIEVLIGSIRDKDRVESVFGKYRPDIVYHAAAHKHVPLMEYSPNEAVKNNVVGTYRTAYAALKYGAKRFVLISTDKAVNPTNVMGASKRLCEMVIQSMDAVSKSGRPDMLDFTGGPLGEVGGQRLKIESTGDNDRERTQFVAVRFGNVLGSNGSVIPRFKQQIKDGGPVTVTHPEITRFFMTIPEAVSLVLQAGTHAWGGEIFVLDMGEPVKIDTLARNMIQLSGFTPDEDIRIVYTGLRPGEKLYEEKLMAEEGLKKTDNDLIYIGKPIPFDVEKFIADLKRLAYASYKNSDNIVNMIEEMVPTFHPVGERKSIASGSESEIKIGESIREEQAAEATAAAG